MDSQIMQNTGRVAFTGFQPYLCSCSAICFVIVRMAGWKINDDSAFKTPPGDNE